MTQKSDETLLKLYVGSKDTAAFEALVQRHGGMVYRVCQRLLEDHQEAQDAAQSVFLVLMKKAATLQRGGDIGAWLYGVARNASREILYQRRRRREREEAVTMMTELRTGDQIDEESQLLLLRAVYQEMGQLPKQQQQAIVLRYLEGRSQEEAATAVGCPLGTLSRRASEGIATLRQRYSDGVWRSAAWH